MERKETQKGERGIERGWIYNRLWDGVVTWGGEADEKIHAAA